MCWLNSPQETVTPIFSPRTLSSTLFAELLCKWMYISDSGLFSLILQGTCMCTCPPNKELHAHICNMWLWPEQDLCAVLLAILMGLAYRLLWVDCSAPEDLGARREEQHVCWFWLKHVVLPLPVVDSLWNKLQPHLSLLSYVFAPKERVSCQTLSVP